MIKVAPASRASVFIQKRQQNKSRVPSFFHHGQVLSFDALEASEHARRILLDRSKNERYSQYFQLWGTILPTVVSTAEFWLAIAVYLLVRLLMYYEVVGEHDVVGLDFRWVTVIGSFTTFLLVFYNNQIYSRFLVQYENAMRIQGRVFNLTNLARDHLPTTMAWQLVRYLNGTHLLGYVGLSEAYERDNFFAPLNARLRFFTEEEVARLDELDMNTGGNCYREVVGWALRILYEAYEKGFVDSNVYNLMVSEVFQLRGSISVLFNYDDQPIPFVYVHLVYYLAFFYLLILAYFLAITFPKQNLYGNIVALLIVSLNNLFTVGMLEIGRAMSDPFGADLCDLSVIHFISFTLTNCRRILTGKTFAFTSHETESQLERERPQKGEGFAHGVMVSEKLHHRRAANKEDSIEADERESPAKAAQQRSPQSTGSQAKVHDSDDEVVDF